MTDRSKKEGFQRWKSETRDPLTAKRPERKKTFETTYGNQIPPLAGPWQETSGEYDDSLGYPGEYPFTRGVQPTMYRGRLWTMRQYAGFGTAAESNERYRYLLDQGTTGLSVAFDLPTQMGIDSDDVRAAGEVGKVGVAIDSLEDMEILLDHIPLDKVSTSMTINSTASVLLCLYRAVGEKQGVDPAILRGTIQNDLLKEYIARGTYIYPPGPSLRLITDIFEYCTAEMPAFNTISISGYHIREAGSDAAQEVGFTLANGIAYVQAAVDRGLDVDAFAKRLAFFFNAHNKFLEEAAKFRAARRMWARIMKERFGAKDPKSWALRFHTQTAGSSLMAQSPDNNVVRVALQAMSAVLGGTQSLHTNSKDEALALPSETSARLALRTQQVIAHESGVADYVDPLGGSYVVEALTDEIEAKAMAIINRVDDMGGMIAAIDAGYPQREIQDTSWRYQQAIESGEECIVGVNAFQNQDEPTPVIQGISPKLEGVQVERLRHLRLRRDQAATDAALRDLERAARGDENMLPHIFKSVKAYATVGEVSSTLKSVFGAYVPNVVV